MISIYETEKNHSAEWNTYISARTWEIGMKGDFSDYMSIVASFGDAVLLILYFPSDCS